jgi:hypothetical protein
MADWNNLRDAQDPNGRLLELVRWVNHKRYEILWLITANRLPIYILFYIYIDTHKTMSFCLYHQKKLFYMGF